MHLTAPTERTDSTQSRASREAIWNTPINQRLLWTETISIEAIERPAWQQCDPLLRGLISGESGAGPENISQHTHHMWIPSKRLRHSELRGYQSTYYIYQPVRFRRLHFRLQSLKKYLAFRKTVKVLVAFKLTSCKKQAFPFVTTSIDPPVE